jgi:hypothetical protein
VNVSGYKDGFKRGTNYCHRMAHSSGVDALPLALLHFANQQARCERGEHSERVAKKGYTTYVGLPNQKRQVPPGTRYCHFCQAIITGDAEDA